MFYRLGRFLQLLGLIILPVAMAGDIGGHLNLRTSLSLSGVGVVVFLAGWLLQQGTRPR